MIQMKSQILRSVGILWEDIATKTYFIAKVIKSVDGMMD